MRFPMTAYSHGDRARRTGESWSTASLATRWPGAWRLAAWAVIGCGATLISHADEIGASGNTDGVLTWRIGTIEPGQTRREVVVLAFDPTYNEVAGRLDAARAAFADPASWVDNEEAGAPESKVWIENGVTDFALEGPCFFRWRIERQALRGPAGGQLSQFTYYVHYRDGGGARRAGVPHFDESPIENIRIVKPVRRLSAVAAGGSVETADGALGIDVRATLGDGPVVAIEFVFANRRDKPLEDVRFTTYANIEANHDESNDFSTLDAATRGLLIVDPPSGVCAVMAGLSDPIQGHAGTWNSFPQLQSGSGSPIESWRPYAGLSAEQLEQLAADRAAATGVYLPYAVDNPSTPETRTLAEHEAVDAIERDWRFQASGEPPRERARREIGWARALAGRLAADPRTGDLSESLDALDAIERRIDAAGGAALDTSDERRFYFAVRDIKRGIAFRNPSLDFNQLMFIDQPYPRGRVNDTHESIHRMGITATPGGRLLLLDGLHPGGKVRELAPARPGSYWRPDISFDAKRALYCFKTHDEKSFHIYELNLESGERKQLTDSEYDDIDPIYLPDGHILFTTTRGNSYVRCGPFIYSYILARCDADGSNVYLISYNGEPDYVPSLMNDGRVIYSRWEYTDKPLWRIQSLWTTNQDGTHTSVFWGNQSVWPDHVCEPRAIPGSHRVMFCGVGHHDWWSGSIGIIDPHKGFNYPDGLTKVTADRPWPECSTPPIDVAESASYHASGNYTGYKTAYPLSERDFLVSARGEGNRFRLYWMDTEGNRELIYEGVHNIWHAIPVKPRPVPPAQADRVAWPGTGENRKPSKNGVFFNPDVYEGLAGVPRGAVKHVRVVQLDHKTYSTWAKTFRHSGPAVSVVQEEGVKRVLSIVPVEPDGSVHFEVPPGRSLYFQLLDEQHRCIQTMRSFTGVLPGEARGCVGCHEADSRAAVSSRPIGRADFEPGGVGHAARSQRKAIALDRPPTPLSPPTWGDTSISFERFAQPVLDQYCGKCHQGEGEARGVLDLTLRPGHDVFKEPYLTLVGGAGWYNPVPDRGQAGYGIAGAIPVESIDPTMNDPRAYGTLPPMRYLSYSSRLLELAGSGGHYGVKADTESLRRLGTWIDACCPFMGDEEIRCLEDPDFAGIERLPIRPRVRTAPVIARP
ncbi:MAG: hypothetical protein FJ297_14445 [Planctomycetes bacterium]|nr:hypothetical protein [Planctomycetota bacterium]